MSATDHWTTIYDRYWTLLEGHAPWAAIFKPGSRIKLSGNVSDPIKPSIADADLPQATLFMGGDGADSMYTLTQNYAYTTSFVPASGRWIEDLTVAYVLVLITRDLRLGVMNPALAETLTALRKGGPRLGLESVHAWGPVTWQHKITAAEVDANDNPVGTKRMAYTLTIPTTLRFKGASLITS
jgi:hypothetical protein